MTDDALALAGALCERWEGFRAHAYLCPAGYATIGFGSIEYLDGRKVRLTDPPVTRVEARVMLREWLRTRCLPPVRTLCPGAQTAPRIAVLLDFTYNLGAGALRGSSLRRVVNAGDWGAVPAQLRRWVNAGGRVLPGLVARREDEIRLLG